MNPLPAFDAMRSPVRIEDAGDRLGVALGYLGVALIAPFVLVWCVGLNCLGWVLDKWRARG